MRRIILSICLVICLATLAVATWKLYGYYRTYQGGKDEYEEMKKYTSKKQSPDNKEEESTEKTNKKKNKCPITVDFESLKKINPEVVGWIHIPETGIDYPIVQAENNESYLHKTFSGKDSYVGAIFLDSLCASDFSSFNSIIYGHNLKNGEMFGHLKTLYDAEYNKKADYKKHQTIWIITPDNTYEYQLFAFREINVKEDQDVYTIELSDPDERRAFLDDQISKSQKKTGIKPDEDEGIITLSTCTSNSENGRFIVQATLTDLQ